MRAWELALAWKILFYRGNPTIQKFSIVTAIGAIAVGVASLVVTLGVLDGMHQEIKSRILGLSPHIFVRIAVSGAYPKQEIEKISKEVLDPSGYSGSPFAIGQSMLRSSHGTLGAVVKAVDPENEMKVTNIDKLMISGEWLPSTSLKAGGPVPIVLGNEAAKGLGVYPGSDLALILSASNSLVAAAMPRIVTAKVSGIFKSGYYEYDSNLALIPLESAWKIWGTAASEEEPPLLLWLGVKTQDAEDAMLHAQKIRKLLEGRPEALSVMPWSSMNQSLFSALKLEKIMLTLVLSLIICVASVSVSTNLVMIAAQKTKMIGSLRSLGVSRWELTRLMLTLGGLIGALGSLIGVGLSFGVIWVVKNTDLVKLPAEIYMIERLPIHLQVHDVIGVVLLAWILSLVASAIPAYRTSRLEASQALRYG